MNKVIAIVLGIGLVLAAVAVTNRHKEVVDKVAQSDVVFGIEEEIERADEKIEESRELLKRVEEFWGR